MRIKASFQNKAIAKSDAKIGDNQVEFLVTQMQNELNIMKKEKKKLEEELEKYRADNECLKEDRKLLSKFLNLADSVKGEKAALIKELDLDVTIH